MVAPDDAVAVNVNVPVPHLESCVVESIVGRVFIVGTTAVLVPVVHPFAVAST